MTIKQVKRILLIYAVIYIVLFIARAAYDLATFTDLDIDDNYNIYYTAERADIKAVSNYASVKMPIVADVAAAVGVLEQKYERIASIVSKTIDYDADIGQFNAVLEAHSAVIQMENRRGLPGGRRVDLTIGVRPESFDTMVAAISQIGAIISSSTTTTDKTYEYRQMLAEKETLERRRASYEELRLHGGSIPDLLQLEERIIDVESQIQQLMVGLGEYSDENALCTINYTIYEGAAAGTPRKLWNALKWSTMVYLMVIGITIVTIIAALVVVWSWNWLKKLLSDKPASAPPPEPPPAP
ncbi:MAG: DUF4349 domain-containing protein [Oscillospiraceae bacterium]|nr:DUF4349 domain-containing protein [Oscillospiraceae bacterium]